MVSVVVSFCAVLDEILVMSWMRSWTLLSRFLSVFIPSLIQKGLNW